MSQLSISCAYTTTIPFFFLLEEAQFVLVFHLSILLQEVQAHMLSHSNYVRFFCNPMDCSPPGPSVLGFSSQEYWSGLPCPPPGDLPDPGSKPISLMSSALAGGFFSTSTTWEALGRAVSFLHLPIQILILS